MVTAQFCEKVNFQVKLEADSICVLIPWKTGDNCGLPAPSCG
ncbi:hypothetical protein HMPREF3198_00280 [Winkia neuii]|nr:hypothetical protein HMPREF3198_00280 [Winkia neuii]